MFNVLIIYECIPEETNLYEVIVSREELDKIVLCHRKFINNHDLTPEMDWLSSWLVDKPMLDGVSSSFRYDAVVVTGFAL